MFKKFFSWSDQTVEKIEDPQLRDWARVALPVVQMIFALIVLGTVFGFFGKLVEAFVHVATFSPK